MGGLCTTCGGGGGGSSGAPPTSSNAKPVITGPTSFTVEEDIPINIQIDASDPDGDTLWFDIDTAADGKFFHHNLHLEIRSAKLFDFEDPDDADGDSVYEFDVHVSDKDSTTTARISITVTDRAGSSYFGETGAAIILGLPKRGDVAGYPLKTIGDIDGDGIPEIIVGIPFRKEIYEGLAYPTGRVHLVSGARLNDAVDGIVDLADDSTMGTIMFDWPAEDRPHSPIGWGIADLGDLDGDEVPELAVSGGADSNGSAYIVRGDVLRTAMNGSHHVSLATLVADGNGARLAGANGQDYAGAHMAALKDIDDDGRAELLVAAPGVSVVPEFRASTYVVSGKTVASLLFGQGVSLDRLVENGHAVRLNGVDWFSSNISCVADAGDFDGDGLNDVVICEPRDTSSHGRVHVVFGKAIVAARSGNRTIWLDDLEASGSGVSVISNDYYNGFGASATGAGDFNSDGHDDVLMGAASTLFGADFRDGDEGAAYVLFGTEVPFAEALTLPSIANRGYGIEIRGAEPGDNTGTTVAAAGDFNNDGFDDILVSSPGKTVPWNNPQSQFVSVGAVHLIFGTAKVPGHRLLLAEPFDGVTVLGLNPGDGLGNAIARVGPHGDVDADTLTDFLVGVPGYGRCSPGMDEQILNSGAVYAISGRVLQLAYSGTQIVDFSDLLPHMRTWSTSPCTKPGLDWYE